jgi:hypothetical protein
MPVDVGAERADEIPFAEVFPILLYVILAIFTRAAEGLYEGIGRTRPDALPWLEQVAVWLTIWAWFHAYARRHRIALIMDFGWLLIGVWFVVVPYYLFKIQRWRALVPIGAYVLLMIAASAVGTLVRMMVSRP